MQSSYSHLPRFVIALSSAYLCASFAYALALLSIIQSRIISANKHATYAMSHYAYAALAAFEAGDNYAYAACARSHAIKRKSNRIRESGGGGRGQ